MPPQSVIERLSGLVQVVMDYVQTIGNHDTELPAILSCGCLVKNSSGEIEYDFGEESNFKCFKDLLSVPVSVNVTKKSKRNIDDTPQRGANRKKFLTSTPKSKR